MLFCRVFGRICVILAVLLSVISVPLAFFLWNLPCPALQALGAVLLAVGALALWTVLKLLLLALRPQKCRFGS